jgi:hypothetical protein
MEFTTNSLAKISKGELIVGENLKESASCSKAKLYKLSTVIEVSNP